MLTILKFSLLLLFSSLLTATEVMSNTAIDIGHADHYQEKLSRDRVTDELLAAYDELRVSTEESEEFKLNSLKLMFGIADIAVGSPPPTPYSLGAQLVIKGAEIALIDDDKPQRVADEKTFPHLNTLIGLSTLSQDNRHYMYRKVSDRMKENKSLRHSVLLLDAHVEQNIALHSAQNILIQSIQAGTYESQRKIRSIQEKMYSNKLTIKALIDLSLSKEQIINNKLLSAETKEKYLDALEKVKRGVEDKNKRLFQEGVSQVLEAKAEHDQSIIDKGIQPTAEKVNNLEKKINQIPVVIAGNDFTGLLNTHPELEDTITSIAIGYGAISIVNQFAQLSNNHEFQKITGDALFVAQQMTTIYKATTLLTIGGLEGAALATTVTSGIGAAISIISALGSKNKKSNKAIAKAFNKIFKQLNQLLEISLATLKNQRHIIGSLESVQIQNKYLIAQVSEVLREIKNLERTGIENTDAVLTSMRRLSALTVKINNRNHITYVNEKINEYLNPFTHLKSEANLLDKRFLSPEIEEAQQLEFVLGKQRELKYEIQKSFAKMGEFLLKSQHEGSEFQLAYSESNNIFNSNILKETREKNSFTENSIYLVDVNYDTPDQGGVPYESLDELYSYNSVVMASHLPKIYRWVLSLGHLEESDQTNQLIYKALDHEQKEITLEINDGSSFFATVNTYFLFKISQMFYDSMKSFGNFKESASSGLLKVIKRRLSEVENQQKTYRAILPLVVAKYRQKAKNFIEKTSYKKQTVFKKKGEKQDIRVITDSEKLHSEIVYLRKEIQRIEARLNTWVKTKYSFDDIYPHELNSKEELAEPEPINKGKVRKYSFVNKKTIHYSRQHQLANNIYPIHSAQDFHDIRLTSPSQLSPEEKAEKKKRSTLIKPLMEFIDVNETGLQVERLAKKYGLIEDFKYGNQIKHIEKFNFYFVFDKMITYRGPEGASFLLTKGEHREKKYVFNQSIVATPRLKFVSETYGPLPNHFEGFGANRPTALKNLDLIYPRTIRGQLDFPLENTEGLRKIHESIQIHNSENSKHKDTSIRWILDTSRSYDRSFIIRHIELPHLKRIAPATQRFDVLYADTIETGVGHLYKSLKMLLIKMNQDLAELYRLAATDLHSQVRRENLTVYDLYIELGIDPKKIVFEVGKDLEELEHLRLSMFHFIQAGYSGCENQVPAVNYLLNINKVGRPLPGYSQANIDPNNIFAPEEIVSVNKYALLAKKVKESKTDKAYEFINQNLISSVNRLPTDQIMIEGYHQSNKLNCGKIAIGQNHQDGKEPELIHTNVYTLQKQLNVIEYAMPHAIGN